MLEEIANKICCILVLFGFWKHSKKGLAYEVSFLLFFFFKLPAGAAFKGNLKSHEKIGIFDLT